mmetsp:Transcript_82064/g.228731  ORF Transcript_82064/g.228731 Transcript_82064/m.228731 type:complete len:218 (-) Transcript_82064:44-697(-)
MRPRGAHGCWRSASRRTTPRPSSGDSGRGRRGARQPCRRGRLFASCTRHFLHRRRGRGARRGGHWSGCDAASRGRRVEHFRPVLWVASGGVAAIPGKRARGVRRFGFHQRRGCRRRFAARETYTTSVASRRCGRNCAIVVQRWRGSWWAARWSLQGQPWWHACRIIEEAILPLPHAHPGPPRACGAAVGVPREARCAAPAMRREPFSTNGALGPVVD